MSFEKLGVGGWWWWWWWVHLDYNVSSGPFLSYELIIGPGPGPELDNRTNLQHLLTLLLQLQRMYLL